MSRNLLDHRAAGVLLHLISLPNEAGIGDMGPCAYEFVDFLVRARQRFWQILPLNPTLRESSHNAYSNTSAYAGNPLLISIEALVDDGLLTSSDLSPAPAGTDGLIDYDAVSAHKLTMLTRAWQRFESHGAQEALTEFEQQHAHWLPDFALFAALREQMPGRRWSDWPEPLRDRHPDAIEEARSSLAPQIRREVFIQWLFYRQWQKLKRYANDQGLAILGDIPIYVDLESAEVWTSPDCFLLDEHRKPQFISGAPPDAFSADGQVWEHPCFHWGRLRDRGFDWWLQRVDHNLRLFDLTRIDHFRGFAAYWEIPAAVGHASAGKWVPAPGHELFGAVRERHPDMPFFAEDLGVITDDVHALKHQFSLPGMYVLMFAFSDDLTHNAYLPHNHAEHGVVYTGTHDTNTARGWFEDDANDHERSQFGHYIWRGVTDESAARDMVELAMRSRANTAIIPLQDWLDLGTEARVNRPYNKIGNYRWRLVDDQITDALADHIAEWTAATGRCG